MLKTCQTYRRHLPSSQKCHFSISCSRHFPMHRLSMRTNIATRLCFGLYWLHIVKCFTRLNIETRRSSRCVRKMLRHSWAHTAIRSLSTSPHDSSIYVSTSTSPYFNLSIEDWSAHCSASSEKWSTFSAFQVVPEDTSRAASLVSLPK